LHRSDHHHHYHNRDHYDNTIRYHNRDHYDNTVRWREARDTTSASPSPNTTSDNTAT
jgi:hypothetical protein